mgnify:CR=1 FL=1
MEYVYAAMLLHKAGHKIDEQSVRKVLDAAGVKSDDAKIKSLVAALDGVDIDKAIAEATLVAAPAQAAPEHKAEKKEEKKEAKDDKKEEEAAAAGLGALFG